VYFGVLDLCACVCKDCTSFLYLSSKCVTSHVSSSPEPGGTEEGRENEKYNEKEEGLGMNHAHCVSWYLGHCYATSQPTIVCFHIVLCMCTCSCVYCMYVSVVSKMLMKHYT